MTVAENFSLGRADLERWMVEFATEVIDQQQALSDLDAASGDADHGSNMERGLSSLLLLMPRWDRSTSPGQFLKDVGLHVVGSVGGSSGALYGTIFLRMARVVDKTDPIPTGVFVAALEAAVQGVMERGKVRLNDKTMLDAFAPGVEALAEHVRKGEPLAVALAASSTAAEEGRDATADMVARRGKSSYARERSRGWVDPGAASVTLLLQTAARALVTLAPINPEAVDTHLGL